MTNLVLPVVVLGALSLGGCDPEYIGGNVSDPEQPTGTPESETAMVYFKDGTGHRHVLTAYNELGGGRSFAGLSISHDDGGSWARLGPLPQPEATCDPSGVEICPKFLRGDPWLATNGTKILYSFLASTQQLATQNAPPDGVAIAESVDGISWTPWKLALHQPNTQVDKPSLSMFGSTAVIAAVEHSIPPGAFQPVIMVTSEDSGSSWSDPPFVLNMPLTGILGNPIVKLTSPTQGYLAYMHFDTSLDEAAYDVQVVRMERASTVTDHWNVTPILTLSGLPRKASIEGAAGRFWRDWIPVSFDIGEGGNCVGDTCQGGTHLYLAVRRFSPDDDADITRVWDCNDAAEKPCADEAGIWRETAFPPQNNGEYQYQPSVTTSKLPNDRTVALNWYQQTSAGSTFMHLIGAYSTDGGDTWSPHYAEEGRAHAWEPCPTPCGNNPCGVNNPRSYGDYFQSAILPLTYSVEDWPWIVTTFAHSEQCDGGISSYDQHVQSIVW